MHNNSCCLFWLQQLDDDVPFYEHEPEVFGVPSHQRESRRYPSEYTTHFFDYEDEDDAGEINRGGKLMVLRKRSDANRADWLHQVQENALWQKIADHLRQLRSLHSSSSSSHSSYFSSSASDSKESSADSRDNLWNPSSFLHPQRNTLNCLDDAAASELWRWETCGISSFQSRPVYHDLLITPKFVSTNSTMRTVKFMLRVRVQNAASL